MAALDGPRPRRRDRRGYACARPRASRIAGATRSGAATTGACANGDRRFRDKTRASSPARWAASAARLRAPLPPTARALLLVDLADQARDLAAAHRGGCRGRLAYPRAIWSTKPRRSRLVDSVARSLGGFDAAGEHRRHDDLQADRRADAAPTGTGCSRSTCLARPFSRARALTHDACAAARS